MDWNNVADEYEALYETTTVQFLPHFLDVLKPRRGFTLTDVGCGPGVVSIAAAKAGATVTSVDISPNMVQRLQARAVEEGVASRLTALVGDGENLPLPVRHSHACVSNFGIIYCPDVDQALREMARVTTGGGWLVVTAWTTEDRNSWTALLPEGWEAEVGAAMAPRPQFRWQSSLELHVACEKANWNDVDVQVYAGSSMALPSWRHIGDALQTPPSKEATAPLSDDQLERLTRLLEREAQARFGEGEVLLPREAWVARGRA